MDCLRVAGGVLLFIIALDMLHAKVSRQRVTKEEIKDASKREDVSICPLAMPLLTGPATITTVIVLIKTGETMELKTMVILAILLTFIVSYVIFRFANEIHRMLGVTGSLVITRVMGLLLGAIAVEFVAIGVWNLYQSMG